MAAPVSHAASGAWVGPEEVRRVLSPRVARAVVGEALQAARDGHAGAAPRHFQDLDSMRLGVMVGHAPGFVGLKAFTMVQDNRARGRPTIQALVALFDADTGTPVAAMDATTLTCIRTAAIAGFATERLAVADAREMLMVGAGLQAPDQIAAVLDVRPIERVRLFNRTRSHAQALAATLSASRPELAVEVVDDLRVAARGADVVTLATGAKEPLLDRDGIALHCHINAMGSFRPDHRELASDVMAAAEVFVDTREGCLEETGDVLIPIEEGRISADALRPLWEADDTARQRLTVLKSVGTASFDIASAVRVARELELIAPMQATGR